MNLIRTDDDLTAVNNVIVYHGPLLRVVQEIVSAEHASNMSKSTCRICRWHVSGAFAGRAAVKIIILYFIRLETLRMQVNYMYSTSTCRPDLPVSGGSSKLHSYQLSRITAQSTWALL